MQPQLTYRPRSPETFPDWSFSTLDVEYNRESRSVWMYYKAEAPPFYSLQTLQDMADLRESLRGLIVFAPGRDYPVDYFALCAHKAGVFNLGGDLAMIARSACALTQPDAAGNIAAHLTNRREPYGRWRTFCRSLRQIPRHGGRQRRGLGDHRQGVRRICQRVAHTDRGSSQSAQGRLRRLCDRSLRALVADRDPCPPGRQGRGVYRLRPAARHRGYPTYPRKTTGCSKSTASFRATISSVTWA